MVIVLVKVLPPTTAGELKVIEVRTEGSIVIVADREQTLSYAETITRVCAVVPIVAIGKETDFAPGAAITEAGGMTDGSLAKSVISKPFGGAGEDRVMVPVKDCPPSTSEAFSLRLTIGAAPSSVFDNRTSDPLESAN